MNGYLLVLLARFVTGLLAAAEPDESTVLYTHALRQHIVGVQASRIWLIGCDGMELPRKIGSRLLLPLEEVSSKQRKAGSAWVIKVLPLKVSQGQFIVTLADYGFKPPNNLVFSGTETFYYRYDSKSKQYPLVRRKSEGF